MRHSLCPIHVPAQSRLQAQHRTRRAGALFGLPPLQSMDWGAAVAELATTAPAQAAGTTLTLLLDTGTDDGAGPRLVAELLTREAAAPEEWPQWLSSELHREVHSPASSGGTVISLAVDLPPQGAMPTAAEIQAHGRELSSLEAPALADALEHQGRDLREALAALREERLAHAQTVRQHREALALLAHDLRSPLLTLNLNLEMLRLKPHSPEDLNARREVMKRQADQLKELAAGLLRNAGPEDGTSAAPGHEQR